MHQGPETKNKNLKNYSRNRMDDPMHGARAFGADEVAPSLFECTFNLQGEIELQCALFFKRHAILHAQGERKRAAEEEAAKKQRKKREINPQWGIIGPSRESNWYKLYVQNILLYRDPSTRNGKIFRRRFRMSAISYEKLLQRIRDEQWFPDIVEGKTDAFGKLQHPLELYVLTSLRILGLVVAGHYTALEAAVTVPSAGTDCTLLP